MQRAKQDVEQALSLSGVDGLLHQVAPSLERAQDDAVVGPLRPFRLKTLRQALVQQLLRRYEKRRYRNLLARLKTPSMQRMRRLEAGLDSPRARQRLRHYHQRVLTQTPREQRLILVQQLDRASYASRISTLLYEHLQRLLVRPAPTRWQRQQQALRLQTQVQSFFLYAYRQVDNRELQRFLAAWQDLLIQGFLQECSRGLDRLLRQQRRR